MFRKLLSNLPFNPSLINQVSFYAKRMHREQAIRRTGFALIALSIVVQMFAVISPPKPTLAASSNDIIYSGFHTRDEAVLYCIDSHKDINGIFAYYGITCDMVNTAQTIQLNSRDYSDQLDSLGRNPQGATIARTGKPTDEYGVNINGSTFYMKNLWAWDSGNSSTYTVLKMTRADGRPIFIMYDCGNVVTIGQYPPPSTPAPPPSTPAPPADTPAQGNLDDVNCSTIFSWAFDKSKPTASIDVHIYIDGVGAAITTANVSRPDVNAVYPGVGDNHGFSVPTPASLKNNNSHKVDVYAIGIDANGTKNGANPLIRSKTLPNGLGSCTTPTPPPPAFTPGNANCSSLIATALGGKSYRFKATTVGTDYVVKSYDFDFGDATHQMLTTSLLVGSADHTYTTAGTYTARVSIVVNVQAQYNVVTKTIKCETPVTVATTPTTPPPTTPPPATPPPTVDVCPALAGIQSSPEECKPCDASSSDTDSSACLVLAKAARNDTQNISDANGTTATAGDNITYTLSVTNTGKVTVSDFVIEENLADVMEYTENVVDLNGATKDDHQVVRWPKVDIGPGATVTRKLTIKIKEHIPETPSPHGNPDSFDLMLTNVYGNAINIKLPGSVAKIVEQTTTQTLPNTGPGEVVAVSIGLMVIVAYFFARSRLLAKELDIVRVEYASTGSAS